MSIVELMVCLAITATLLTATAAAYRATVRGVEANEQFFRATQGGRIAVNHITTDVRRCTLWSVSGNTLTLNHVNGQVRTYTYDSSNKKLTMTINSPGTPTTQTLASNVTSASFNSDGKTVSLVIVVSYGSNSVTLSGSGLPRRTMVFN